MGTTLEFLVFVMIQEMSVGEKACLFRLLIHVGVVLCAAEGVKAALLHSPKYGLDFLVLLGFHFPGIFVLCEYGNTYLNPEFSGRWFSEKYGFGLDLSGNVGTHWNIFLYTSRADYRC